MGPVPGPHPPPSPLGRSLEALSWDEGGVERHAMWHSESGAPVPTEVVVADDSLTADAAMKVARRGGAILWRGDYHTPVSS